VLLRSAVSENYLYMVKKLFGRVECLFLSLEDKTDSVIKNSTLFETGMILHTLSAHKEHLTIL